MLLMALGPIIFAVPTFSFEGLSRKVSGRAPVQAVVGAAGPVHLLGPNPDTISLTCSFFPYHLNGGGLGQLRTLQEMVRRQVPMMMVSYSGLVFGRWIVTDVDDEQTLFHPGTSTPQRVDVTIAMTQYTGDRDSNLARIGIL